MAVSPEKFKRVSVAKESAFETAGTYKHLAALQADSTVTASRVAIERDEAADSKGRTYASTPGEQTYTATVNVDLHGASNANVGDLLEGVAGSVSAGGALTLGVGSTASAVEISSGTPAPIVQIEGDDGKLYYVALKSNSGTSYEMVPELPSGVVPADVENLSELSGDVYPYTLGTAAQTYSVESDWSARPSGSAQQVISAHGAAISSCELRYQEGARAGLSVVFGSASSWTRSAGPASNVSDPATTTHSYRTRKGDALLTKESAPAWDDAKTPIRQLAIQLAPPLVTEVGMRGLDGGAESGSVLPGSAITGYTRDVPRLTLSVTVPYSETYEDDYEAGTAYRLFAVLIPGVPGNADPPSARAILYFPRLVQSAYPAVVVDAGAKCSQLTFFVEDGSASEPLQTRYTIALVDAA